MAVRFVSIKNQGVRYDPIVVQLPQKRDTGRHYLATSFLYRDEGTLWDLGCVFKPEFSDIIH
jgi:hypothetical protein